MTLAVRDPADKANITCFGKVAVDIDVDFGVRLATRPDVHRFLHPDNFVRADLRFSEIRIARDGFRQSACDHMLSLEYQTAILAFYGMRACAHFSGKLEVSV